MKRKIACGAFWVVFFVDLFALNIIIGTLLTVSVNVDFGSAVVLFVVFALLTGVLILLYRLYDPFREKYSVVQETPLVYHWLVCNIGMPLGILISAVAIFRIFAAEDFPHNSFYFIDLLFMIISLGLACVCVAGLKKLKPSAWYALMLNLALGILYGIVIVIIYDKFAPFLVTDALAKLMGLIFGSAIMVLYYYKRRDLFLSPQLMAVGDAVPEVGSDVEETATQEPAKVQPFPIDVAEEVVPQEKTCCDTAAMKPMPAKEKKRFCSRCGSEIDPVTKKCTGCGRQYFRGVSRKAGILILLFAISCISIVIAMNVQDARRNSMEAISPTIIYSVLLGLNIVCLLGLIVFEKTRFKSVGKWLSLLPAMATITVLIEGSAFSSTTNRFVPYIHGNAVVVCNCVWVIASFIVALIAVLTLLANKKNAYYLSVRYREKCYKRIAKLHTYLNEGIISQEEYEKARADILKKVK